MQAEKPVVKRILFTVDEAAAELRVSTAWIYERTRTGAIPFRRLGRLIRFSEADIQAIIDQPEAA